MFQFNLPMPPTRFVFLPFRAGIEILNRRMASKEILPIHVPVLGESKEEPALVAAVGYVAAGMVVPALSSPRHGSHPQIVKTVFSPSDFRCKLG